MRGPAPQTSKTCLDCPTVFMGAPNRKRCDPCRAKRIHTQNCQSAQRADKQPVFVDMPEEVVDRLFTSALAEIRRTKAHRIEEPSWDYRGRYREP